MYQLDEAALECIQSQARRLLRAARKCDRLLGAARETLCAQLAAAADSAPSLPSILPSILPSWPFPRRRALQALCASCWRIMCARVCACVVTP
jgi:hypothetical protein